MATWQSCMVFEKRPFILIEVFIAIALLTLCAFPLISSSLRTYYYQRDHLIELEMERQAELLFYRILKENLPAGYDAIKTAWKDSKPLNELKLPLGGVKATFYPHYHLYYSANSSSDTHRKVHCGICFPKKEEKLCFLKREKFPYKFDFLVKKIAEKLVGPDAADKEVSLKEQERSTGNVQAADSGE